MAGGRTTDLEEKKEGRELRFRGHSFHTIDPKGRIVIPARFREVLQLSSSNRLMISKLDRAVVVYPLEKWDEIEKKVDNVAVKSDNIRRFKEFFIGGAFEYPYDKQWRILIPPTLREYGELEKEIVLIGVLGHFQVRSMENWRRQEEDFERDYSTKKEMRDEIADLGL